MRSARRPDGRLRPSNVGYDPVSRRRDAERSGGEERGGRDAQGGPLSPLLANIYLDALDQELERCKSIKSMDALYTFRIGAV